MSLVTISTGYVGEYHGSATPAFARLYADQQFTTSESEIIESGSMARPDFYQEFTASLVGVNIQVASGDAYTTTDSNKPYATYTLVIYDTNGAVINVVYKRLRIPPDLTPTTWATLESYSASPLQSYPDTNLSYEQFLAILQGYSTSVTKATDVIYGTNRLSLAPATVNTPIAVGDNDARVNIINAAQYSSFSAAVDAVAALSGTNILEITTSISSGSKTVPSDVILQFANGGKLTATSGTITVQGEIRAPAQLCFVESGGTIDISAAKAETFYFEWFGITSGADNSSAMQKMLDERRGTYLATNNGTNIQLLEETVYSFASPLDMDSAVGICIRGAGGGLRYPSSEMRYTGGNVSRAIDIRSAFDLTFVNLRISYTHASFAGVLMEAGQGSNGTCSYFYFQNVAFTGTTSAYLASALLKLNDTNNAVVNYCRFEFAQYGLQGTADASGFSYAISITNSIFNDCGEAIRNPSQSWTISANVFEAIFRTGGLGGNYRQGDIRIIGCATTHAIDNIRFLGNWCGDSSASASTYYVFNLYGAKGFEFSGNFVNAAANLGSGGLSTMFGLSACFGGSIVNNSFQASDYFVTYHTSGSQGINISNNQTASILNPVPRALGGLPLLQQTQLGNPDIENMIDGYVAFTDDAATNTPITSSVNSIIVGTAEGANLGYGQAAIRLARSLTGYTTGTLVITPNTVNSGAAVVFATYAGFATTAKETFVISESKVTANVPLGYAGTGVGGTATQSTSKATTVVLSKACGDVTLNNANLNAGASVSFTLTNTLIAATDVLKIDHISGGTAFAYDTRYACGAGSATITVKNVTAGNLAEAPVFRILLIKAVNS